MNLKTREKIQKWIAVCTCALLTACGGGGNSSSGPVTSTDTFQFRTAYVSYLQDTRSMPFTITGTSSGNSVTGNGTATQGSMSAATFEGQAAQAKTTTVTGSYTVSGQSKTLASTTTAYVDSNYNPLGFNGSSYTVVTSSTPIPTTARVGDTGTWYSATRYSSSSKSTRSGTESATYVLEPDTASTALLKIIQVQKDTNNSTTYTTTTTFRLTPSGALTRLTETGESSTSSLTATYN